MRQRMHAGQQLTMWSEDDEGPQLTLPVEEQRELLLALAELLLQLAAEEANDVPGEGKR